MKKCEEQEVAVDASINFSQYHLLHIKTVIFSRRIITKLIRCTKCREKCSEYYTCKGCEDEMNRKGHLTKP